jgi:hypothetical protein
VASIAVMAITAKHGAHIRKGLRGLSLRRSENRTRMESLLE